MGKCVFCGNDEKMTNEDIVPVWTNDSLPPGDPWISQTRESGGAWAIKNKVRWKVAAVCTRCNSGWMSRLERQVIPLIGPAIQGTPRRWTRLQQRRVSTWAFKTALMSALGLGLDDLVPSSHFATLFRERRPPGVVRIWALAHLPSSSPSTFPVVTVRPSRVTVDDAYAYWIVLSVGFLAFSVFSAAARKTRDRWVVTQPAIAGHPPERYAIPIWPAHSNAVRWPPPVALDPPALERYARA